MLTQGISTHLIVVDNDMGIGREKGRGVVGQLEGPLLGRMTQACHSCRCCRCHVQAARAGQPPFLGASVVGLDEVTGGDLDLKDSEVISLFVDKADV